MVWQPKGSKVYISSDGDDIGSKVSASILSGNIVSAKKLSLLINLGGKLTEKFAVQKWGGHVIILGGDDVMVVAPSSRFKPEEVEVMRALYHSRIKATLSCGIGSTPEEAMKSLVIAKNTGKNKAVFWDDSMKATYMKVVKARINDLKTKLAAQTASKTESIPNDLKAHIKKELHRLIKERKRRNDRINIRAKQSQPNKSLAPGRLTPKPRKPSQPKPTIQNNAKLYHNHMVDLMRSFIIHHKIKHDEMMNKAVRLSAMGHHKEADAFRRNAKLLTKKMLKNHAVIHTATNLGNAKNVPMSIRNKLTMVRNSIAASKRRKRVAPAAPKALVKRSPSRQLKSKAWSRNVSAKPKKPQLPKLPTAPKAPVAGKPPKITKTQIFGKSQKLKIRRK